MFTKTEIIQGALLLAGASALAGCSSSKNDQDIYFESRSGMLVDLNKCIGCAACVMACKVENGTPHGTYWCNIEYKETGQDAFVKRIFKPVSCNHCENAQCVMVCPAGASRYQTDGTVQVDQDICIGCHNCITACPYKMRHFNFIEPDKNPAWRMMSDHIGESVALTQFEQAKANGHKYLTAEKCTFCKSRRAEGKMPACVETCITGARIFGRLDDPNGELMQEIERLDAKPMTEENTKTSIYYAGES